MSQKIVVVGGSAAGPKTAARAKRMNQDAEVILLQKDPELSMASCGYPYYVADEGISRAQLISTGGGTLRDAAFFEGAKGVKARVRTEVVAIDRDKHMLAVKDMASGATDLFAYDKLILCTGASPRRPPLPGIDLDGITALHSLKDADFLRQRAQSGKIEDAVVVGGGLIGVETAESLVGLGIRVTLIEMLPQILPFLDEEMAKLVENHMRAKGVNVILGNGVDAFLGRDGRLDGVRLKDGSARPCQLAVVAIGVVPNSGLARDAGLSVGMSGGIAVDRFMRTSDPDIYAAGDCVEVAHRITGKKVLAPLGDLANLQGRVAGENAATGDRASFPGTIQTGICRVFDYAAGSTGLSERRAREEGFDIVTAVTAGPDKPGFMKANSLISKMVVEAHSGRLLGFQCIGPGDVSRQLSEAAMAVMAGLSVEQLTMADLPYAPPFSPAIDNLIAAAHVMENKMRGLMTGISAKEVKARLDAKTDAFLLDVRGPAEYEETRLGIGETLIPIGQLRKRTAELPQDKSREIVAYCRVSMRGYEAQRILEGLGWRNVKVMEGGILAWPYTKEK